MLHKTAVYWLDLASHGWWGRDDNATMAAATDAMWGNTSHVLSQWQALLTTPALQTPILPAPEIAIFVDEVSAAARPILGRGGSVPEGFAFETRLQQHPWQDLAGVGAPVAVFLQSDLLRPGFPFAQVKLAVFLNAFMLSSNLRHVIKTKLQSGNRTVAMIYAPGVLDAEACAGPGSCTASAAAASQLVGLPLDMDATTPIDTTTTFDAAVPRLAGVSYGAGLGPVSPWLSCSESTATPPATDNTTTHQRDRKHGGGITVLGRYGQAAGGGKAAMCQSSPATAAAAGYRAVFIGAPRPPMEFWRGLAQDAGVHLCTLQYDPHGALSLSLSLCLCLSLSLSSLSLSALSLSHSLVSADQLCSWSVVESRFDLHVPAGLIVMRHIHHCFFFLHTPVARVLQYCSQ
eukprot:COSAG05_NODE_405_length_10177_cov_2.310776_12_plen_403_part_00